MYKIDHIQFKNTHFPIVPIYLLFILVFVFVLPSNVSAGMEILYSFE